MKTYERRNLRTQKGGKELAESPAVDATPRCGTCGAVIKGRVHRCARPSAGFVRTAPAPLPHCQPWHPDYPREDGITVEVTIPPREESEGAEIVRLADAVIQAANDWLPGARYAREDLAIALNITASGTTWKAELGRARVDGAPTAVEALSALLTIVKRYQNTTSRGA